MPLLGGVGIGLAMLLGAIFSGIADDTVVPLVACMAIFVMGLVDDVLALKPFTKLIGADRDGRGGGVLRLPAELGRFAPARQRVDHGVARRADQRLQPARQHGRAVRRHRAGRGGDADGRPRDRRIERFARPEVAFLAVLAGAVSGFLVYNFPPASIFMGDSGALLLGFGLAMLTLGNEGVRGSRSDVVSAIAGPVFVLLIPIFDTTLVTVLRLLAGRSPAMGGRDHSSHRLVAMGLSERSAVVVLWLLAAMGGGIGLVLRSTTRWCVARRRCAIRAGDVRAGVPARPRARVR